MWNLCVPCVLCVFAFQKKCHSVEQSDNPIVLGTVFGMARAFAVLGIIALDKARRAPPPLPPVER